MRYFVLILCIFILSGCISMPRSPTPRFYSLQPMEKGKTAPEFNIPANTIIGFGPVKIPEYEDRPQIVTKDGDNRVKFAEFDRWGESLNGAFKYVISEDLAIFLHNAIVKTYPWDSAIQVKYQVIVDVVRLDSELDKNVILVAEWSVIDAKAKKMLFMKRTEFKQPIDPHNYSGLAGALSRICVSFASDVAEALNSLDSANRVKAPEEGGQK